MISVLIPTRQRPRELLRTIESARATATVTPEFICYVDDDDRSYDSPHFYATKFVHGPRVVLSNTWNKCAAAARGDIFMQGNDDIVFRTSGWDSMVEEAFAQSSDKILMVHGSDGSRGYASGEGGFGPHPFVHRRWFEILGYFTPAYFSSDYGDTWINELANAVGRRRYIPFIIEHMHYCFGKAQQDATTSERLERHSRDDVERLYKNLAPLREVDIEKLKAAMR